MINERLMTGKENTITGRELAAMLHCDIRTITETIERERREGQPICANMTGSNAGYYLAADHKELEEYCNRLKHRENELNTTRAALIRTLKKISEKR